MTKKAKGFHGIGLRTPQDVDGGEKKEAETPEEKILPSNLGPAVFAGGYQLPTPPDKNKK